MNCKRNKNAEKRKAGVNTLGVLYHSQSFVFADNDETTYSAHSFNQ